jgi:dTDP-4-dehydrorhamnose 3,5-epimerase
VEVTPLAVPGTWLCTHPTHADDRGSFGEWLRADALEAATGRTFSVQQANVARSRRGVIRGVHFTRLPVGQAKYVYCTSGSIIDIMVDLRDGSPTFGAHAAAALSADTGAALFMAEGIGHAYAALEDDTTVTYLVSSVYNPEQDGTVSPFDPDLALPWPTDLGAITLSDKDRDAPSLAAARAGGDLPGYDECLEHYQSVAR